MVEIQFEDPPEHHSSPQPTYDVHKNADRDLIVTMLAHHPGRWAVVSRHLSRNRAAQVARLLRARHTDVYQFRVSMNGSGEGVVYGRYAGPDANI